MLRFIAKNALALRKEIVYFHFGNFWSVSIQNAKSSGAKCNAQTFIKFQNILYLSYLDLIQTFKTPAFLKFGLFKIRDPPYSIYQQFQPEVVVKCFLKMKN
jgi:hypothetical protein